MSIEKIQKEIELQFKRFSKTMYGKAFIKLNGDKSFFAFQDIFCKGMKYGIKTYENASN